MKSPDNITDIDKLTRLAFRKPTLDDIALLSDYFRRYPSRSCDYSVGGVMMWKDYFNYRIATFADSLFIKGFDADNNRILYYRPCGPLNADLALALINRDATACDCPAVMISDSETSDIESEDIPEGFTGKIAAWKDYLYPIANFIGFSGKKMEKKRNHLNYFLNNYGSATVEPIGENNIDELIEFTLKFKHQHPDNQLFNYESDSTIETLRLFGLYPFSGIALRYEGKIIGFSYGEKSGDTFFVHVEKGDTDYRGIYQAISSFMARRVSEEFPDVRFLNREDDTGNEYLRQSKLSYHPSSVVEKAFVEIPFYQQQLPVIPPFLLNLHE